MFSLRVAVIIFTCFFIVVQILLLVSAFVYGIGIQTGENGDDTEQPGKDNIPESKSKTEIWKTAFIISKLVWLMCVLIGLYKNSVCLMNWPAKLFFLQECGFIAFAFLTPFLAKDRYHIFRNFESPENKREYLTLFGTLLVDAGLVLCYGILLYRYVERLGRRRMSCGSNIQQTIP